MAKIGRLSSKQVELLLEKGRKIHSPFFIFVVKNTQKSSFFAISVPKKGFRSAVERNKIKRWVREVLRNVPTLPKAEILVVVKKTLQNKRFLEFKEILASEVNLLLI